MCVLVFAWHAHPGWRLVAAGNRDELHARPAAALAKWSDPGHLIAGRDLESGGTWLGVSTQGRFAAVTNLRGFEPPLPDRLSRGALVVGALAPGEGESVAGPVEPPACNPFNLVVIDGDRTLFRSNRPNDVRTLLAPGIYGVSNGSLDEPWPKTLRLKERVLAWVFGGGTRPASLLDALGEDTLPAVGVRSAIPSDIPQEPAVSPIFIRHPVYGTRCSTVVAVDAHGDGVIVERRYSAAGDVTGETSIPFRWPG